MTATQYPINDTNPVGITQNGTGPVTVFNESTTQSVLLSETPNPAAGYALGPGNIITLDGGKPLYAALPSGGSAATITVIGNGGTISSASAIAQQILSQGLATDIAAEIALNGAPSIDSPAVLLNSGARSMATAFDMGTFNVSKYSSLSLWININAVDPTLSDQYVLRLTWYADSAATVQVALTDYQFVQGTFSLTVPSVSAYVTAKLTRMSGASDLTSAQIVASFRNAGFSFESFPYPALGNAATIGTGSPGALSTVSESLAPNTTFSTPMLNRSGNVLVSLRAGASVTAGSLRFRVTDLALGSYLLDEQVPLNSGVWVKQYALIFPISPVGIEISTDAAALPNPITTAVTFVFKD